MFKNTVGILVIFGIYYFVGGWAKQLGKRNGNRKFYNPNELEILRRSKAAEIKSLIDSTQNPCYDFYEYVCGNWARIHGDKMMQNGDISRYTEWHQVMDKKIEKFISTLRAGSVIEGKIRTFHQSCMNVAADGCEYIEALKTVYEEYGKFSFMKPKGVGKSRGGFNWWQASAKIYQNYGYEFIIGLRVEEDDKEGLKIYIEEPDVKTKDVREIKNYLRKYIGASSENSDLVAREVMTFEKALLEAKRDRNEQVSPEYFRENLTKLHRHYRDLFDIESFLRTALNLSEMPSHIYIENTRYFDNLLALFENTNPDTLEDYILWRLTHKYLIDIDPNNMNHLCSMLTTFYFSKYIENRIYQEYRLDDFESDLIELWENLKAVLLENLQSEKYPWMASNTREKLIKKFTNMDIKILYHDDGENFEDFFKDLEMDPLNYVQNLKTLSKHKHEYESQSDTKFLGNEQKDFLVPVYFMLPFNLWHPGYPKALLYARMGRFLATSIFSFFDDLDILWDTETEMAFEERRLCFETQYHNDSRSRNHKEFNVHDQFYNIAEISSLELTNSAYIRWLDEKEKNHQTIRETFPGMSYNNQELFFISYGQDWCLISSDNELVEKDKFQLSRVLSNSEIFAQVFKCEKGARLNPERKCKMF